MKNTASTIERKSFEIKGATLKENMISGNASVTGVLDRGRDVIFPGAWKKSLKGFLDNGFVAVGHAWDELPVAMPTSAKEVGNELQTEATFHSTAAGQDARTVCRERMDKGLSVGLSVGFVMSYVDENHPPYLYFESGQKMLDYAKANAYDMALFDTKSIKACKGYCRGILEIAELLEYSIVPVPMNQAAGVSEAKSADDDPEWAASKTAVSITAVSIETERDFEGFLRDAGYSKKHATAITLHGFKALQRDAVTADDPASPEDSNATDSNATPPGQTTALLALRSLALRSAALRVSH